MIDQYGQQPRPTRPVRRGYRNGGRFNPYALYAREMKPQSYIQTTQFSYKGNGLIETVGMGAQDFLQEVATPGGNNVQMSRDNREGQFLSGVGDLWDAHNESMKNIFSFNTIVQYGENGIVQTSTDMVITDAKLALQQIEYERNVKSIEKQLGELDFTGKSLEEIIEISAERKSLIQQKLGMSPKEKLWIQFFNDPKSFQSLQFERYVIPEFRQN